MRLRSHLVQLLVLICSLTAFFNCEKRQTAVTDFTKADSLTDRYLALQENMLEAWNTMIHDDNRKIKNMQMLLHELRMTNPEKQEELKAFEDRLNQLTEMRYDQQSLTNSEVVSQYDFASTSLVAELISLGESEEEFPYNTSRQKLVDSIRSADQRVNNYREEYDQIVQRFNHFVEQNKRFLKEVDEDFLLEQKPLFHMAGE
jgi:septal ring factor EnvC (AmiA/AmiB activator)